MINFQDNMGKLAPEWQNHYMDFNEVRGDWVAVASAGRYAIICTSIHASTSSVITPVLQARCSSWCPTNGVKAMKAIYYFIYTSLKDVDTVQQVVASYPQPLAGCKA